MPRKKLEVPSETPTTTDEKKGRTRKKPATESTPEAPIAEKKPRVRKPKAAVAEPAVGLDLAVPPVEPIANPAAEAAPTAPEASDPQAQPETSEGGAAEPVIATPKPSRSRRTRAPKSAPPAQVQPEVSAPSETVAEPVPEPPTKGRSRRRSPKAATPEPVVDTVPTDEETTPAAPAEEEPSTERKSSRRRRRRGKKDTDSSVAGETAAEESTAPLAKEAVGGDDWEDELPVPIWRPIAGGATLAMSPDRDPESGAGETEGEPESEDEERQGGKRRRRRRRRGTRPDEVAAQPEVESEAIVEPVPAPEPEPPIEPVRDRQERHPRTHRVSTEPTSAPVVSREEPRPEIRAPRRLPVEIPEDAPQVVLRNGVPTLVRNHRVYPALLFFGSPDTERRANTVLEELRMAAESGVHLHSFLVEFEVDRQAVERSVAIATYILAKAVEVDPDAQVLFRISFIAPRNWPDKFPSARYKGADGELAEPSVCDDEYWGLASQCLETFVKQLRLLDLRDHILGLHLERGEWFLAHDAGYDTSLAARNKFRDWTRTRYLNDEVTLRASWFDGQVRFDNIMIPEYRPEGFEGERFVRSSRKQRKYVDYHLFLSDATVGRISDLAYAAKKASEGYFLIGASYGYTFEWSHPASGHLSLGKLLRAPEIDFIAGPPSYKSREPGGAAPFPCPIDSFALNGKLYLSEEDFKTSLSQGHEPDDFNPPLRTPQALDSVHWRGVGAGLAHSAGVQWMDLWGNGWLRSHSIWERARRVLDELTLRLGTPLANPEVAVFIDERALAYLVDENAFTLLVQNVREAVLRSGVSAAFYLLSDLQHREKFPESKLYLFLNAWDIRPELRAAIKSRLQRDGKVLFWLYSAGMFDAGRESLERAREVTGIALKPQPFYSKSGTTILNRRHPLAEAFPDRSVVGGTKLEPSYFAIPEDATVLGEYSQTGLPSFVVKDHREGDASQWWTSVFLGEPLVNPALIRALAQMAGAHVYNFHGDVTHVRPPFLTVHCTGSGQRTVTLPPNCSAYNLLTRQWAAVDTTNLRFSAMDGSTHVFLVGSKEELEVILNRDPRSVLRIDRLPAREANVLGDISSFDVPIMKLDEWIETGDSDEVADEWFLRAPQISEEIEQATEDQDRPGRRRRRRRGRGGNGDNGTGSEEIVTARAEPSGTPDDGFGLSVMFRKRE